MASSLESEHSFSSTHTPNSPLKQKQTTRFYSAEYLKKKSSSGQLFQNEHTERQTFKETKNSLKLPGYQTQKLGEPRRCSNASSTTGNIINTRKYIREQYGPFLCSLLLISAFLVILGGGLMLAGFYVPALELERLQDDTNSMKMIALQKAEQHNKTLNRLRISGVSLLSIGLIGLTILFLTPIVCLRRTEYTLLPDAEHLGPRSSFSSASGLPDDMFTFSVVKQHIQPKKQTPGGSNKSRNSRSGRHQKSGYDKGFLSPELNRGPIFVSDDNYKPRSYSSKNRNRSSSFESRLSPRYSPHNPWNKPRYSISGTLTPDIMLTRSGAVKAGSFHSLR
uniref:Uncharacterized protein n=1 Tax=Clytia hemisphaerica TaxID=252671 RepID=A0A7M6DQN8_9CNID|eukprot:TCONS_00028283-protein